jgi:hypothetical protein
MSDRALSNDSTASLNLPREVRGTQETSIHPIVGEIAIAAAVWFIAVVWLAFAWGGEVDLNLAIVTLFFVIFFSVFLLTASYTWKDPRWRLPATSFRHFLAARVGTATGEMRGRDALIEIAVVPVSLAVAATLIGLAWVVLR